MSIANVVLRGAFFFVHDEKGRQLAMVSAGGGSLQGYTRSSFSIKRGAFIYTYDERGRQTSMIPAR